MKEKEFNRTGLEIAVIGISGRFPGARNIDEFWNNLKNGIESISFLSDAELKAAGIDSDSIERPGFVKACGGILEDKEVFDASFFNYTPKEAGLMDMQIRIFHECAWAALEDAGYDPTTYDGLIGLYAGAARDYYLESQTLSRNVFNTEVVSDRLFAAHLLDKDYLAGRVAFKLDLKGPAVTLQTTCSTSLVAIDHACRGLLTGICDITLAGGISLSSAPMTGYRYQDGMIFADDGHCRAFETRASGTISGEGAAVVVLKRLDDALSDGDQIYCIIKGSAVNNDGTGKSGYSAPSLEGQAAVIRMAQQMAEVEAESISYIEAHGTGTAIGDPIEAAALTLAFNTGKRAFCRLGSVKTNIGHLDAAAGAAAFIKTVLALKHKQLPPTLHFEQPNPEIDFKNSPFYVNNKLEQWTGSNGPLRAGVSSFGIGGTNAHVILEEWLDDPSYYARSEENSKRPYELILLSAKSESALDEAARNLAGFFKKNPGIDLGDAAYTLKLGRKSLPYRRMSVCSNIQEAVENLSHNKPGEAMTYYSSGERQRVVFMFPGQGSQYVNMGLEIYQAEPVFREKMDHCFEILKPLMGFDLKGILYPALFHPPNDIAVDRTEVAQPIIFAFEYALASLLIKWGIKPDAMIGHSIGEYTAACLAGVFKLEDALELVSARGKLMQQTPPGAMLSISLSEEEVMPFLATDAELSLAAVNSSCRCVVSGTFEAAALLEEKMKQKNIAARRLSTSHAFHSRMMEPMLAKFAAEVRQVRMQKPQIPYISNVTGDWITEEAVLDHAYWTAQLRKTVRFAQGIDLLLAGDDALFIEVGPGRALGTFVRQQEKIRKDQAHLSVNLIRHAGEKISDFHFLVKNIGRLWLYGSAVDWKSFYEGKVHFRISLPTYPFAGKPYKSTAVGPALAVEFMRRDNAQRYYLPSWKRTLWLKQSNSPLYGRFSWVIFTDDCGLGEKLAERLENKQQTVIMVKKGASFSKLSNREFIINPANEADYVELFDKIGDSGVYPTRILHLWNVTGNNYREADNVDKFLETGFYSLLYIARILGKQETANEKINIEAVTDLMHDVAGSERSSPGKAVILGPVQVIPKEYGNLVCRSIDVRLPRNGRPSDSLAERLITEFYRGSKQNILAFRRDYRWEQAVEPVELQEFKSDAPLLKKNGFYWIIGGTGGIGFTLAEYIAGSIGARLLLTGRSGTLSPQKLKKVEALEKSGAKILVMSADAVDQERMKIVLRAAEDTLGRLNGVIHAAGLPDGALIAAKKAQMAEQVLAVKIKGTLVLDNILHDKKLDFFLLCSSLNSILPAEGQAAYTSANLFIDAFARFKRFKENNGTPIVSINWDRWENLGMAAAAEQQYRRSMGHDLRPGIKIGEGIEAFRIILQNPFPQVMVAKADLPMLIEESRRFNLSFQKEKKETRPALSTEYAAPTDELEQKLVDIWCELFGFHQVGVNDDFFELGGDSLKAVAFVNRYTELLGANVPVTTAFETPTIAGLAAYFRGHYPAKPGAPDPKLDIETFTRVRRLVASRTPDFDETSVKNPKAVFILSPPRSGSTLLRVILAGHSRLFAPPELGLLSHKRISDWQASLPQRFQFLLDGPVRAIMQARGCSREDAQSLLENLAQQGKTTNEFYGLLQEWIGDRLLVDKTPYYSLALKILERMELEFDRPLYLHLLRHPYGMIRSYRESRLDLLLVHQVQQQLPYSTMELAELTWTICQQNILKFLTNIPQKRQHQVYFEDLVRSPRRIVENISRFLGIEFDARMLEPYKDRQQRMTDGSRPQGTMIGDAKFDRHTRIEAAVADNWKEEFSSDFLSNETLALARSFDYETIEDTRDKNRGETFPLSFAQEQIWFLNRLEDQGITYNMPLAVRIKGKLKIDALQRSLDEIIRRHQVFRVTFAVKEGEAVQLVGEPFAVSLPITHLEELGKKEQEIQVKRLTETEAQAPYDLEKGPLFRMRLLRLGQEHHVMILVMHHIIADGWSSDIFFRELTALYPAYAKGESSPLKPLPISYMEYVRLQRAQLSAPILQAQLDYWKKKLAAAPAKIDIPTDKARPAVMTFKGSVEHFEIDKDMTKELKRLSRETGSTLFMTILCVYALLLYHYSKMEDILIGSAIANRSRKEVEPLIGLFANTLVMRIDLAGNPSFMALLKQVRQVVIEALLNQDVPFEMLVNELKPGRSSSYNPLYQVAFHIVQASDWKLEKEGISISPIRIDKSTAKFDLVLFLKDTGEILTGFFDYNTGLFEPDFIKDMIRHFLELVNGITRTPEADIAHIEIMTGEEKRALFRRFEDTTSYFPLEKAAYHLFEDQVERSPDRIALIFNRQYMSYRMLNRRANRLAGVLNKMGAGSGSIIAILLARSPEMVIGILGVLKSGAGYLPIDSLYPDERIKYMLAESQASLLITSAGFVDKYSYTGLQSLRRFEVEPYTSGWPTHVKNLDELPIPDRSLVNYEKYFRSISVAPVKRSMSLLTTRGCPYRCAYCHAIWAREHVFRSAENILEEVKRYYDIGVDRFTIVDDIFNLEPNNSAKFFQLIIQAGLKIQLFFTSGFRGDLLTPEYIDLMMAAGTTSAALALETASPRLQKLIKKNLRIDKLHENLDYICRFYPQLILELQTMVGFPTETEQEAAATLDFIKSLEWLHFPYLHILKIYRNTEMTKLALANGISMEAIVRSENLAYHEIPGTLPFGKDFLLQLQARFLNDYFLSKERLRHVLRQQLAVMTEDEIIQKYNSYLAADISSFTDLMRELGMSIAELGPDLCLAKEPDLPFDLEEKMKKYSICREPADGEAFRVLLLDLSQYFSGDARMLYDVAEAPLGLMYLMTYLKHRLGGKVVGKVAKSRIDFDNYSQLRELIAGFQPDVIGIRTLTLFKNFFHRTLAMIRCWGYDLPIIAGGPYATTDCDAILQDPNLDLLVLGEGEITFCRLIEEMITNKGKLPGDEVLKEIKGIAFIPQEQKIRQKNHWQVILLDDLAHLFPNTASENLNLESNPGDLFNIIYTSGSTGKPKGVMVEHSAVVNLIFSQLKNFQVDETDRVIQFSSLCFDASVEQIFLALSSGAALILVEETDLLTPYRFEQLLSDRCVTHLHAVPSFLKTIDVKKYPALRRFIAGGDVCQVDLARSWHRTCDFYNEYGPTETTVTSVEFKVKDIPASSVKLPIGKPLQNTYLYVLDNWQRLVPAGLVGELYIGGAGVSRGYLNKPESTMEKFINASDMEHCATPGLADEPLDADRSALIAPMNHYAGRLYRTGDLVRLLPDGNIEFYGRVDSQVKVRGFRIELDEIKNRLLNYNSQPKSIVTGDRRTCSKCLLPGAYPGIRFDRQGKCNICNEYDKYADKAARYFKTTTDFRSLMEKARQNRNSSYDCLLLFSGGKDSTYVLQRLVEMGFKVLAFTFDNGYISPEAFGNIERITHGLDVDSVVYRARNMKGIFVESLKREHSVCDGCFRALTTLSTQAAIENGIDVVITGLSRGQIFDTKLSGLFQQGIFAEEEIENKLKLFRKIYHSRDDKISKLLDAPLDIDRLDSIHFVDFFRYEQITTPGINDYLQSQNSTWQRSQNTGFCSTNCLINDAGIYVHTRDKGYHNYAAPLSWQIRLGLADRETVRQALETPVDSAKTANMLKEIGYCENKIKDAVVVIKEDKKGEKYLCAYFTADTSLAAEDIKEYLSAGLPGYMVPGHVVQLEQIPLTLNGKIDWKALPEVQVALGDDTTEPQDEVEIRLAEIWSDILNIEEGNVGINANFFDLGGHSLKATQLISKIHQTLGVEIPLAEIFTAVTIRKLARSVEKYKKSNYDSIKPIEKKEFYPLSPNQLSLYVIYWQERNTTNYNTPIFRLLEGKLDTEKMAGIFKKMIERHESFRTSFYMVDAQFVQRITGIVDFSCEYYEIGSPAREISRRGAPAPADAFIKDFVRPFDLAEAPLLRVRLTRIEEEKHILAIDMHHIVSDGFSLAMFVKEVAALYENEVLTPLRIQYKDFIEWQARQKRTDAFIQQETYWLETFKEPSQLLRLPTDYPEPGDFDYKGDAVQLTIEEALTQKIRALASRTVTTVYILLLAIYKILLSKYCNQNDIVVGIGMAGRRHADLENVMGMFIKMLPIRSRIDENKTFKTFLKETTENMIMAYDNQDYPTDELVKNLNWAIKREPGRNPLFNTAFNGQNLEFPEVSLSNLALAPYPYEERFTHFDLILNVIAGNREAAAMTIILEYSTQLFERSTAEAFARSYIDVLEQVVENEDIRLRDIRLKYDSLTANVSFSLEEGDFDFNLRNKDK